MLGKLKLKSFHKKLEDIRMVSKTTVLEGAGVKLKRSIAAGTLAYAKNRKNSDIILASLFLTLSLRIYFFFMYYLFLKAS